MRLHNTDRPLVGLVAAFGVSAIGFGAITPFLVVWGHRFAGLHGAAAGLLFVAQAAGEITGGLAGGLLADRVGGRQVLFGSTVGMAIGYGSLALITSPGPAIALIFFAGLFEAAYHPTAFALIGELTTSERRQSAYAAIRTAGNIGAILGPLAGALIATGASIRDTFLLTAALLVVAGLVAYVALPSRKLNAELDEEADEIRAAVPGLKAISRDRRLRLLVLAGALLTITLAWWEADGLAIVHTQRSFGASSFSIMLALSAGVTALCQIPITRLSKGRSIAKLLGAGVLLQTVGVALLAAAGAGITFVVVGVLLMATGDMLYGPQLNTLVSEIAPAGRGVTYQAAISTTYDVGNAGGPASGLALSAAFGAPATWLLALPLGLVSAIAAMRAARISGVDSEPARQMA